MSEWLEKEVTLAELGRVLGVKDFSNPNIFDIDDVGLEVMTPTGYRGVSSYVVKENAPGFKLGDLTATGAHQVMYEGEWKSLREISKSVKIGKNINVVDIEVPNGNCYCANGFVNHNTTPGG